MPYEPDDLLGMGNCFSGCSRSRQKKKITLLLLGLDNAGKTSAAKCLLREPRTGMAPTVGFSIVKPQHSKHDVTIYDLGGGQRIRGIWKNYFAEAFGLIFVVDANDPHRLDECKETLLELIKNPKIAGKPVLLLVNKQDCIGALDDVDICEALNLNSAVNEYKCRTRVETCSAVGRNGKIDRAIVEGFHWLVEVVANDYIQLSARVLQAVSIQKEAEEKEKAERSERVRKIREERNEEDTVEGGKELNDFEEGADPFKPVETIKAELDKLDRQKENRKDADRNSIEETILEPPIPTHPHPDQKILVNGFVTEPIVHDLRPNSMENKLKKKKKRFAKNNRTAPLELASSNSNTELPPVLPRAARNVVPVPPLSGGSKSKLEPISISPPTSRSSSSAAKGTWGLAEELEPVEARASIEGNDNFRR